MKTRLSSSPHPLIKRFYRFIFLPTVAVLVYSLIVLTPASAQTISISLWPPRLEAMIKPGKSITQVYRLKNQGDDTQATIKVVPFAAAGETGRMELLLNQPPPAFFSLLNADLPELPVELQLKAGETQELVLKIAIPATAKDADYPVALIVETATAGLLGGSGSIARPVIAVPILLTVSASGQPQRLAKIEEFRTSRTILKGFFKGLSLSDSFDDIDFVLRVKNQSLTRLEPVGQIDIYNTFGRKIATLTLSQDSILAGTIRQLKSAGTVPVDLTWDPVFPLGRYTATAQITPMDTTNTISQTISFWVIPYKALLIIGLLLIGYKTLTNPLKQHKLN